MVLRKKILSEFKKYAKKGRGKAFLIFRENRHIDFTKEILDLCLHNYAYDPQCEGERSEYAMQFFRELNGEQKNAVASEISKILKTYEIKDDWDWNRLHFFITAAKIAREGFYEIGDALLERFSECDDYAVCRAFPAESILTLLDFEGLSKIAERRGEAFLRDRDESEDDSLLYCLHGVSYEDARKMLEGRAKSSEKIRAFLERIEQTAQKSSEYQKQHKSNESAFEQVKSLAENNKMIPRKLRNELSDDEKMYFAKKLLEQKSQKKRLGYIRLFDHYWKCFFPDDPRKLLPLFSKRKNSWYNERLVDVLTPFALPELREIAGNALESDDYGFFYLALLKKNFRVGDGEKITKKLAKEKKPHAFHHSGGIVLSIFEANITADCRLPLELFVEETVCGQCRLDAVDLLAKAGVLSAELKAERAFDSYELSLAYGD